MQGVPDSNFGAITREQFLFFETKIVAQLLRQGLGDKEIVEKIKNENLFQYPTEKSLGNIARCCLRRLHCMNNEVLLDALCDLPVASAKQIGVYSMMKFYKYYADFMITVIGEKYRTNNLSFSKADLNVFFLHLQEQDESIATWSEKTIAKLKQVLVKVLVETDYLESVKATELKPILINQTLENVIRANNENSFLLAFNCFS